MEGLGRGFNATLRLLEVGASHEAMMDSPMSKSRMALKFLFNVLKTNIPLRHHDLIGDLKDEICRCQRDNERAFKLLWNLYVISQQHTDRQSDISNLQDRDSFGQALDSLLHGFHVHPFSISSGGESRTNLAALNVLNRNHETATRYEELARRFGKAWVEDRVPIYNAQVKDLGALQTSLFELLWNGTVEKLKRHSAYSVSDAKPREFEGLFRELEKMLQDVIVRSKQQRFTIAFCGVVKAGTSLFLNALVGRTVLPSDGEANDSRAITVLIITTELPSAVLPCRLRHVEGQTVPELHFQPDPFIAALKELQVHQYGQKVETYEPPTEDMFEALLSYTPSQLSEEEVMLRRLHSKLSDMHTVTRDNLLEFERPGFELPPMAAGERNVKKLVNQTNDSIIPGTYSTPQLGQLNDIVRLCQRFGLKFDMSRIEWPLLTVEFGSLHGHKMDGIYEVWIHNIL